jgi:hypothetical protein
MRQGALDARRHVLQTEAVLVAVRRAGADEAGGMAEIANLSASAERGMTGVPLCAVTHQRALASGVDACGVFTHGTAVLGDRVLRHQVAEASVGTARARRWIAAAAVGRRRVAPGVGRITNRRCAASSGKWPIRAPDSSRAIQTAATMLKAVIRLRTYDRQTDVARHAVIVLKRQIGRRTRAQAFCRTRALR